jgi:hypothetical protein
VTAPQHAAKAEKPAVVRASAAAAAAANAANNAVNGAGVTRDNVAVRSSELPRADLSSAQRKRKIEQHTSFLAPSDAAVVSAASPCSIGAERISPTLKAPRLDDAAQNLLDRRPHVSMSSAFEPAALASDLIDDATELDGAFVIMRGTVPEPKSPTFEYTTPYRPPMRNAQQTLTMSSAASCTVENELECIDETAALMQKREDFYAPIPSWLSAHPELKPSMRAILLDWLRELSCPDGGYKLHRSTYHTAVNVFDRFMSRRVNVPRTKVQLIGAAALLIASKLEESYRSPNVETLLFYCDGLYQRRELLRVEALILRTLDWRVTPPTPFDYAKLIMSRMCFSERAALGLIDPLTGTTTFHRELPRAPFNRRWLVEAMQLLDTAVLDNESMRFRTYTLAITALACTRMKKTNETANEALAMVLEHWEPQLPETRAAVAAASAVPRTPALVSNRSQTRKQTVTSEQVSCVCWMLPYMEIALVDRMPEEDPVWIDFQDWNKNSLDFVRTRLRERTSTNSLSTTRILSNSFTS